MNSSRMPPGADTKAMRRLPKVPSTTAGPQMTSWPSELGVEIVGEQGGVQEALGREVHGVFVDGVGEERDHDGAQKDVGTFPVVPVHAVADLGPGGFVERHGGIEIGHLHRHVRHPGDRHRPSSSSSSTSSVPSADGSQPLPFAPCQRPGRCWRRGGMPTSSSTAPASSCVGPAGVDRWRARRAPWSICRNHGYPVPAVEEVSDDGTDLVMERIDGPSMVDFMSRRPWTIRRQGMVLATLHRRLHAIAPPDFLPLAPVGGRGLLRPHGSPSTQRHDRCPRAPWSSIGPTRRGEIPLVDVGLAWVLMEAGEIPSNPVIGAVLGRGRAVLINGFLADVGRGPGRWSRASSARWWTSRSGTPT